MSQIYRHISPSGKSYIGKTKFTWEIRALPNPEQAYYGSPKFLNAIRKYGWENFTHEVLEDNIPLNELSQREAFWIEKFDSVNLGYNFVGGIPSMDERLINLNLSKAEFSALYYDEKFSLREISNKLGTEITTLRRFMELHGLKSLGRGNLGNERLKRLESSRIPLSEKQCIVCGKTFIPRKFKNARSCSNSCSGKLSIRNTVVSDKVRNKISNQMQGNSNALGNKGGIKTAHNRWHIGRGIVKNDCIFCLERRTL